MTSAEAILEFSKNNLELITTNVKFFNLGSFAVVSQLVLLHCFIKDDNVKSRQKESLTYLIKEDVWVN